MTRITICLITALVFTVSAPADAQVQVNMNGGLVTVRAKDATVRQILAEWARVGQTRIVNAERVTGAPVTLELVDMPEKQALDVLLRSVSGYLAAPRPTAAPNASRFDRIIVLPGTPQPRTASSSIPPPPLPQAPRIQPFPGDFDVDGGLPPAQRAPIQATPPPAPPLVPPAAPAASPAPGPPPTTPGVATGTRAPGMVVPPPPPNSPGVPPSRF
jgi:hypothetical protein